MNSSFQLKGRVQMVKYLDKFPFAFHVIALEPIKVQTRSASQNDCLNVSFVKDTYGNSKKMARKDGKMVIYESQILGLPLYLFISCFLV